MISPQGRLRSFRSSTAFITFVIAYAVFTDQFIFAAVIPVYPYSLQNRVHVAKENVQFWVAILLATFGIACVVTAVPWGVYTDRSKSRRWPFTIGLLIILGSTFLLWFTTTLAGQVVGRFLQGFSSTVIWTSGMAVLVDTVGYNHIGEYMGYVGIALNAGSLVAPCLGGVVFAKAGYHAVYGVIVGIVGLDIAFRLIMIERTASDCPTSTSTASLETDLECDAEVMKDKESIRKTTTISTKEIPPVSSGDPKPTPRHRRHPMIRLICSSRYIATCWGSMITATVFSGFQATLPMFVHDTFGWDAVGGGLIFIPLSFPAVFGPVVGRFTDRYGGRWFALAGFVVFAISLVLLRLIDQDTTPHKALLCVLLTLVGSSMALLLEPLLAEITYGATRLAKEDEEQGIDSDAGYYGSTYAWFNIAWATGNAIGPVIAGLIVDTEGWGTMTLVFGVLSGVSAVPVGLWCGGWYFRKV